MISVRMKMNMKKTDTHEQLKSHSSSSPSTIAPLLPHDHHKHYKLLTCADQHLLFHIFHYSSFQGIQVHSWVALHSPLLLLLLLHHSTIRHPQSSSTPSPHRSLMYSTGPIVIHPISVPIAMCPIAHMPFRVVNPPGASLSADVEMPLLLLLVRRVSVVQSLLVSRMVVRMHAMMW